MSADDDRLDRLTLAAQREFRADSLVGSFFHGTADRSWQGCVVAEPSPGVYLVELFGWVAGDSTSQHLVRLADMAEWTFYDSSGWMTANADAVRARWRTQRGEDSPGPEE